VDIEDNKGNTPLHFAVASSYIKIIQHLTKTCHANPSIINNLKQKPKDIT
jgi:ankyrin repeat protein